MAEPNDATQKHAMKATKTILCCGKQKMRMKQEKQNKNQHRKKFVFSQKKIIIKIIIKRKAMSAFDNRNITGNKVLTH